MIPLLAFSMISIIGCIVFEGIDDVPRMSSLLPYLYQECVLRCFGEILSHNTSYMGLAFLLLWMA